MKWNLKLKRRWPRLTFTEFENNLNQLMYYGDAWSTGSYEKNEVVTHSSAVWVVTAAYTDQEPSDAATDWDKIGITSATTSDNAIAALQSNNLHGYSTINSTYQELDLWDTQIGDHSNGISINTSGQISLTQTGWYEADIYMLWYYTSFAADREVTFRMKNVDTAQLGQGVRTLFPTGSATCQVRVPLVFDVTTDPTGDTVIVEFALTSGTDITGPSLYSAYMVVRRLGDT